MNRWISLSIRYSVNLAWYWFNTTPYDALENAIEQDKMICVGFGPDGEKVVGRGEECQTP
ncbi:MAG: hypothetical protein F6J87_29950 [Spirulina sp. SIO3F2]|nr:hypothetical protein [Spirulina sp. SIO3F2]